VARRCDVCGKGSLRGHQVSHAHNLTLRRWFPNLQRVRAMVNGKVQVIRACTECLRSGRVMKAPRGRTIPAA
jgi:large subunit ribosomal protein L28